MVQQPVFGAIRHHGKLKFLNEPAINAFLWKLKEGEQVKVKISRKRSDRSTNQNAWYWGCVLATLAHETGHTAEELHEIFKRMFLHPKETELWGKKIRLPASTASLSVQEFYEYVERIRAEAAMMGINIPDPE